MIKQPKHIPLTDTYITHLSQLQERPCAREVTTFDHYKKLFLLVRENFILGYAVVWDTETALQLRL